jgi:hypothetical protein
MFYRRWLEFPLIFEQIVDNSTLPVTISSIRLIGAEKTRRSFLDGLFNSILSANRNRPYTLSEALQEVGSATDKLRRFGEYSVKADSLGLSFSDDSRYFP